MIDFAPSLETIALIEEMAEEVAEGYAVVKQIREKIMDKVPNVIDVTTQLTPKGEYIRQFLGSET